MTNPQPAYITQKNVCAILNISRITLIRWRSRKPDFPKEIRLSNQTIRFDEREIRDWVDSKRIH